MENMFKRTQERSYARASRNDPKNAPKLGKPLFPREPRIYRSVTASTQPQTQQSQFSGITFKGLERGGFSNIGKSPTLGTNSKFSPSFVKKTNEISDSITEPDSFNMNAEVSELVGPYNSWTSFFSKRPADEIFQALCNVLNKTNNLDHEVKDRNYRIRGRKFDDHIVAEFQIRLFKVPNDHEQYPNQILVEIQRRCGDGMVFQRFLVSIINAMAKRGFVDYTKVEGSSCSLRCSAPTIFAQPFCFDEDPNIASDLIEMCENNYCEGKRSAATILARQTTNESVNRMLIDQDPNIVVRLGKVIDECKDAQVVQALATAIVNILKTSRTLREQAVNRGVRALFERVERYWRNPTRTKHHVQIMASPQVANRMEECILQLDTVAC